MPLDRQGEEQMAFKYFTLDEFACKETGENHISLYFVATLDRLREDCGFPFIITSGYRSPNHSIEAAKDEPGIHTEGIASDIAVNGGSQRYMLVKKAMEHGFNGIGVDEGFVHLDRRSGHKVLWVY